MVSHLICNFLEFIGESFAAVIVVLGIALLTRLMALFKPCKHIVWGISGALACISFGFLLFLLLFANGMSAGPTPSVAFAEILLLIGVSVFIGGLVWLSYYYWRFVWPVCVVLLLAGLFGGGICG